MNSNPLVHIYVDGGCSPNPGTGAWAAVLKYGDVDKALSGVLENSTNNRAELTAVIEALRALKVPCDVTIHSDSQWVIETARGNYRRGANLDLWTAYDEAAARHTVTFVKVKGHSGNPGNERCHRLVERALWSAL